MAIKLTQTPKFTADVTVEIANERGGHDKNKFKVTFFRAETSELEELRKLEFKDMLAKKVAGWTDVVDDDGNQVPFTPENLATLLEIPAANLEMARVFYSHQVKARTGN